jgi:hypothetical protein
VSPFITEYEKNPVVLLIHAPFAHSFISIVSEIVQLLHSGSEHPWPIISLPFMLTSRKGGGGGGGGSGEEKGEEDRLKGLKGTFEAFIHSPIGVMNSYVGVP